MNGPFYLLQNTERNFVANIATTRHQSRPAKLEILQTECGIQAREAERYGRHEDASDWRELRETVGRLV